MATTVTKTEAGGGAYLFEWTLANGETGDAVEFVGAPDRSVQLSGTFGSGGTVVIEGSIDGLTYATLTDPQGNALSVTAAKIEAITELVRYIRPRVTAGDGTTAIKINIVMRSAR